MRSYNVDIYCYIRIIQKRFVVYKTFFHIFGAIEIEFAMKLFMRSPTILLKKKFDPDKRY